MNPFVAAVSIYTVFFIFVGMLFTGETGGAGKLIIGQPVIAAVVAVIAVAVIFSVLPKAGGLVSFEPPSPAVFLVVGVAAIFFPLVKAMFLFEVPGMPLWLRAIFATPLWMASGWQIIQTVGGTGGEK